MPWEHVIGEMMKDNQQIAKLFELFQENGFEIRMVGGAVRDHLLEQFPDDIDFCTPATVEQMKAFNLGPWKILATGEAHGTLTFLSLFGAFEVTTLRKDIETDGRHAVVEFTESWEEDAARRDFTINQIMMDAQGNIFDFFNGQHDLKKGIVRFVGNPEIRIQEDALRMIRYLRFHARFGKMIDFPSQDAIEKHRDLIKNVSRERIWQEIKKAAKEQRSFHRFIQDMNLFGFIRVFGVSLELMRQEDKPHFQRIDTLRFPAIGMGLIVSPEDVDNFADIFKLSNDERKQLAFASMGIRTHRSGLSDKTIREMIVDGVPEEWIEQLCNFIRPSAVQVIKDFHKPKFPVSGNDLMPMGFKPGPEMGKILSTMKRTWMDSNFEMTKEQLIKEAIK